jgi:hypothetical protein
VLQYVEGAFLRYCQPDAQGNFSRALPPNNLREKEAWYESDFALGPDATLAYALESVKIRNQVSRLLEKLHQRRVMIVGGFGGGSDYLARMALRDMAVTEGKVGLFRIMQFAGNNNEIPLRNLLSDRLHAYGTGLILRDLLDPVRASWPHGQNEHETTAGFVASPGRKLLHNYDLKGFLNSVRRDDNYSDTRIIITSQYDSLDKLKFAVEKREYGDEWPLKRERLDWVRIILDDFGPEDFWNPIEEMTETIMYEVTRALLKAWLTAEDHEVPRWLGRGDQRSAGAAQASQLGVGLTQLEQLTRHAEIAGGWRIAAWCRIWVRLLGQNRNTREFYDIDQAAFEAASKVSKVHNELHSELPLGLKYEKQY